MVESAAKPPAMRVLVTGAAGFIGSHLAERLLSEGHSVWGLDNFDPYYDESIKRRNLEVALGDPRMHFVEGDIRDEVLLTGLFDTVPFDLVVHLAARPGVRPSIAEPGLCYDVNVTGTLRLLEIMRRRHVSRLVFASSSSVYGEDAVAPFSEDQAADRPVSPYAASKRSGELLCHAWHELWGTSVHCLRFFTVYGPRQRPDLAINKFIRLLGERRSIPMYGDGTTSRDYTHVDDIVEGICRSIGVLRNLPSGEPDYRVLNLGHGRGIALRELIDTLAGVLGVRAKISREPDQPGDVSVTLADTRRSREVLGFEPRVEFRDGIRSYVAWLDEIETREGAEALRR